MATPREHALKLLEMLGNIEPPVPLKPIMDHLGLKLFFADFGDKQVSGILYPLKRQIVVNRAHHAHRQRFTVAHEIGHYVMHALGRDEPFTDRDFFSRDERVWSQQEREANSFAAQILIPSTLLSKAMDDHYIRDGKYDRDGLATMFKISPAAMDIRLSEFLAYE